MLIGRYPFEDPTNHSTLATMKNICAGNFARPSKGAIDADALNLIENMLVPEPRRRFSLDDINDAITSMKTGSSAGRLVIDF